jgi:hypothetical protein
MRPRGRGGVRRFLLLPALVGVVFVANVGNAFAFQRHSDDPGRYEGAPVITVLSNRADLVSGGEALVQVTLPGGADPGDVRVYLNGHSVTSVFAVRPNGKFEGLVTGLVDGKNLLTVFERNRERDRRGGRDHWDGHDRRGGAAAQLTITNHSVGGPVFAGPQVQPWICGTTLGAAQDAQCDAATQFSYVYMSSTTGQFAPYDPSNPPTDVATTTTDQEVTVPYIVRIEQGVEDREYYEIAVLFDPSKPWAPWAPQSGWNGKLVVPFGGDCKPWHMQATPDTPLLNYLSFSTNPNDNPLASGFAVANSGGNKLGSDCNDVVSAETLMMLKEHLVDTYGPIRYTIGEGCSGGSMQQQWDVADYPGLLDGIIPQCSFPDIWDTVQEAEDCHLLDNYFDRTASQRWTTAEETAVDGYVDQDVCRDWDNGPGGSGYSQTWFDPSNGAACASVALPPPGVFDPLTNPNGVRCTLQDYEVAQWGTGADGYANRPYDNVGVQDGLKALLKGEINAAQFIDLNQKVGGIDINWNYQPQRTVASPAALRVAYRAGEVDWPAQAANVPIIDLRGFANDGIHSDYHSYMMRARLDEATGGHGNQIIWTSASSSLGGILGDQTVSAQALPLMDQWLSAIEADRRDVPPRVKVVQDKPAAAVDACWISGVEVTDQSTCNATYPYYADPRMTSGAPLADNYVKCQLEPLRHSDYPASTFTDRQWAELESIFPTGVCDYSKLPMGFQPSVPWLTFANGPGGQPLGPPPVSHPIR